MTISKEKITELAERTLDHQRLAQQTVEYLWKNLPRGHRESLEPQYGEVWVVIVCDRTTLSPVGVAMFTCRGDFWAPIPGDPWGDVLTPSLVVPLYRAQEADE